jgi:hypothetical protein
MGGNQMRADDGSPSDQIISAGIRSVVETGDSATVSLPRSDIENILGIDIEEELIGSAVSYRLYASGKLVIDIDRDIRETDRGSD